MDRTRSIRDCIIDLMIGSVVEAAVEFRLGYGDTDCVELSQAQRATVVE